MRERLTGERLQVFMRALGRAATAEARVYFTGGATVVLLGWRYPAIDPARFRPSVESLQ